MCFPYSLESPVKFVSVIEERKQGVKRKSFMVRDRNMYFFIYIPLEKRIFNHRKNEPFTYITIVTAYVVQWLACSPRVRYIVGSSIDHVNPKIMKFVFVASPLSTQH